MIWAGLLLVAALALAPPVAAAPPADDAFIAGYATAVLDRELGATPRSLSVNDGVVTLVEEDLAGVDRARVVAALSSIRGVREVRVVASGATTTGAPAATRFVAVPAGAETAAASAAGKGADAALAGTADPAPTGKADTVAATDAGAASKRVGLDTGFLPPGHLFDPLLADPRWPHFYASYQRYMHNQDFKDVASVGFGETIVIYRGDGPFGGQWEGGVQAGVFAIFDLDSSSKDLLNADYFVGLAGDYAKGGFQTMGRVFHRSSHLGDEFLLDHSSVDRVNLSYEAVDLKLSYHLLHGVFEPAYDRAVRVYAGGGYLFDQDPPDLKQWYTQAGLELQSPWTLWGTVRPVVAVDLQNYQQNNWHTDVSVRAGLSFESLKVLDRKLVLLFEYFNGNSPNGQFSKNRIEYAGAGLHFYY